MSIALSLGLDLENKFRTKYPELLPPKGHSGYNRKLEGVAEFRTQHVDKNNLFVETTRYIYLTSESSCITKYIDFWGSREGFSYTGEGYEYVGPHKKLYTWSFSFCPLSMSHLYGIIFHNNDYNESTLPVKRSSTEDFLKACNEEVKKPLIAVLSNITALANIIFEYLSLTPPNW
jgi:hypothetical protein